MEQNYKKGGGDDLNQPANLQYVGYWQTRNHQFAKGELESKTKFFSASKKLKYPSSFVLSKLVQLCKLITKLSGQIPESQSDFCVFSKKNWF